MVCGRCGEAVDASGVFPGAAVRCACGAEGRVPPVPAARPAAASFYRRPPPPRAPSAEQTGGLDCPRCRAKLAAYGPSFEGERAYGCDGCRGAFVERLALEALGGDPTTPLLYDLTQRAPPRRVSTDRYVRCPRCGETMNRGVFGARSGVVVDVCAKHGTWFDRGELERATRFVAEGGLEGAGRRAAAAGREREAAEVLKRAAAASEREPPRDELSSALLAALLEALAGGLFSP